MRSAIESIARAVGISFGGISVADIQSTSRARGTSLARAVVIYLSRSELGLSYPEAAREVCLRDSSSACHAVNRIVELIAAADPRTLAALEAGERAAEEWRVATTSGLGSMRERRRNLTKQMRSLALELEEMDRVLGDSGELQAAE
jgi:hypothetical protein